MRTIGSYVVLCAATLLACGGETPEVKPPQPPPPPTVASAAPPPPTETAKPEPPPPPKPSMAELQKQMLTGYADAVTARDAKKVAGLYAEDGVLVVAGMPEVKGRDALAKMSQEWFDGMSGTKLGYTRAWQKGDVLVVEWVVTGKHTGDFMGVKASNKDTGVQGISVVWFNADGTIKVDHRYFDMGTTMTQIGASKEKARPVAALPTKTEWIGSKDGEDKNLDVVKQYYGFFDKGDDKGAFALFADDAVMDDYSTPAAMKKADAQKYWQTIIKAFPGFKQSFTNTWTVGDYVIIEGTFTGNHKAAFQGIAPTKKDVNLHFVDVNQVKDGKVKTVTTYLNNVEFMTQLGQMKPPAAAAPKKDEKPAAPKK
jgi:steroid delta-isomerase-like uncharacterized protein